MQKWSACYSTCKNGADKYQNSDNWSTFDGNASTCVGLKDKVSALTNASNDSANAATAGQNCDSNSSSSASAGASGDKEKDQAKDAAAEKSAECTANPNLAGCAGTAAAATYAEALKGTAGFNQTDAGGAADVTDTAGVTANAGNALIDTGLVGAAPKNGVIANNTGGGIPGGGGGASANGGTGARGGVLGAVASAITDIEKGFQSGGFTGAVAALLADGPAGAEAIPSNDPNGRDPASLKGQNLADFLPGHRKGPSLNAAAIEPPARAQIHGPTVSLFSRITAKYQEKCILGELFDCR